MTEKLDPTLEFLRDQNRKHLEFHCRTREELADGLRLMIKCARELRAELGELAGDERELRLQALLDEWAERPTQDPREQAFFQIMRDLRKEPRR